MGLAIDHCFACDNLPAAKLISDYYFKPNKFFSDIRLRDNESLPSVDLYVSGFPCRAWSQEGTRLGLDNSVSGELALHSLLNIKQKRPVIVVLENVIPGNGEAVKFFEFLCEYIRGLGYIADWHFANQTSQDNQTNQTITSIYRAHEWADRMFSSTHFGSSHWQLVLCTALIKATSCTCYVGCKCNSNDAVVQD